MENNILGQRLKQLRIENGLTQEEFGKPYDLRKSTVSQYESGASRPDDELKIRIALDYEVSLDWLMGFSDTRSLYNDLTDDEMMEVVNFIEFLKYKRELKHT